MVNIMPNCAACESAKPAEEFYENDRTCKACRRAYARKRRATNPAVQAYDRERSQEPHRVMQRRYVSARWRDENPDRYKANNAVNNAIRDKRLARGTECTECGSPDNLEAHHADYKKKLDVRWLCALCHRRLHFAREKI